MEYAVICTGSAGNCSYLTNQNGKMLMIDCGLSWKMILKGLNYDVNNIEMNIVDHQHIDHLKAIDDVRKYAIPVWQPYESGNKIDKMQTESYKITAFEVPHNVPNKGFYIEVDDERILFATDFSYLPYSFKKMKCTMLIIECNHQDKYLNNYEAKYEHSICDHCSLETCKGIIQENDNECLKQIILIHPSKMALDKAEALEEIKAITNKPVCFAEPGLCINI